MEIEVQEREGAAFVALVLCGGLGTRLRPTISDRPKPLAPVADEPFLVHVLDQLVAAGCARAILCTGHLGDQIEVAFGTDHDGMVLTYSRETEPLGTAGALALARAHLDGGGAVVMNGDSFVDVDLRQFVAFARRAESCAAIVTTTVGPEGATRYGAVKVDGAGLVTRFCEKGGEEGAQQGEGPVQINAGVYWFGADVLSAIPASGPVSLEREVLPPLAAGDDLAAFTTAAAFLDIGVPSDYARAPAFFQALEIGRQRPRRGLLVVDRDGTLIEEKHYLADPAGVAILPGVVEGLRSFCAQGYDVAIVTNQSGIGRGYFDAAAADAVNAEVLRRLDEAGIPIRGVYVCPHAPDAGCECRKPAPGLATRALTDLGYSPDDCLVVGDKRCDIDLGARLGTRTALVRTGYGAATERDAMCAPDVVVDGLVELAEWAR